MTESLELWLEREYRHAAPSMLRSISASDIVKERVGFGQRVRPVAGSIVASPVLASWDPEPDYFFHWFRDSAIVIDAVRLLYEAGDLGEEGVALFAGFIRFSLSLQKLDGRPLVAAPSWRSKVQPEFVQYLRGEDLAAVHGDAVYADVRVNPDGTLDIWEEELGHHYFTLRVSAAALEEGAGWLRASGSESEAGALESEAESIRAMLDGYWDESAGHFRSRVMPSGASSVKMLDIAVILAAVHADARGAHSAHDPRMHATLVCLEDLFGRLYAINRERPRTRAPAMGRYEGDVYFSGGAYYFSTLGAAEFCFRAASAYAAGSREAGEWVAHGDAFLETVRAFTPASGDLSEQFDRDTGRQTSARHLAWSYAAVISCRAARRTVLAR